MTDPEVIILAVCEKFDVTIYEMCAKDRHKPLVFYRHIAMRLPKHFTLLTLSEIGMKVGLKDHTSVIYALTTQKINPFENEYNELLHILMPENYKKPRFKKDVLADAFVFTSL